MPRFIFTSNQERLVKHALGILVDRRRRQGIPESDTLLAILIATPVEASVVLGPIIQDLRARVLSRQASIDADTTAEKAMLSSDLVDLDTLSF